MNKTKNKIVAITGMTGVGKDYLIDRANDGHHVTSVNWGTMLGDHLKTNRDRMMGTVDPRRIRAAQFVVCGKLLDLQPVAVTCHTVRPSASEFSYDIELEQTLNPSAYVFVTAPPEIIAERVDKRNALGERQSEVLSIPEIDRIQAIKLTAVSQLAHILSTDLIVIDNVEAALEHNVSTLRAALDSIRTV